MREQDYDRERQRRQTERDEDWDWYYYEYRYFPYSPYRTNEFDRNRYGREASGRSGRDIERSNYGRDYQGRDYDYESYPYGSSSHGRYSGVGPRGYRRSDERITDDINDRLTWYGQLDATEIEVDVNDGVVTLNGTVDDRQQKRMAEDVVESVSGVEDVNNQLNIRNRRWNRSEGGMSGKNQQIRPGMEVIGRDGENVGEVKEVRSNDFLVDRSMARDIYIPMSACRTTEGQIRLNVRADEVENQGWEMPDLMETETSQKQQTRR